MATTATSAYIELEGTTLEGGGQLIRNAVAFAALTRTPIRIDNVRQNRDTPGLKAQHAAGLALVTAIANARAEGIEKGSTCVSFDPTHGWIRAGEYEADPGTAGSTTLLLQISLPALLFPDPGLPTPPGAPDGEDTMQLQAGPAFSTLNLRGGTNAIQAPQADYTQHVLVPFLNTYVLPSPQLQLTIKERGFYPYGGGLLHVSIPTLRRSQSLRPVMLLERGSVVSIEGSVIVSGSIGQRVANEMRSSALHTLRSSLHSLPSSSFPIHISTSTHLQGHAGSAIFLLARTSTGCVLVGSALGRKGVRASITGAQATQELIAHLDEGGCVDSWMQDQMIVFLALAKGRSVVRTGKITLHTRTAIWVAEQLTGAKFKVQENVDGTEQCLIICDGIGLEGRLWHTHTQYSKENHTMTQSSV